MYANPRFIVTIWSHSIEKHLRSPQEPLFYQLHRKLASRRSRYSDSPKVKLFFSFKTPPSDFHRNERGFTSHTVSSNNKTTLDISVLNSFFIYVPPPDVDNASSFHAVEFNMFTHSRQGVNTEFTRPHCTKKPDLIGFKCDFWPVDND